MPDRDELLRQIGEKVVERCDPDGYTTTKHVECPVCERPGWTHDHADDCAMTRYLEATDE